MRRSLRKCALCVDSSAVSLWQPRCLLRMCSWSLVSTLTAKNGSIDSLGSSEPVNVMPAGAVILACVVDFSSIVFRWVSLSPSFHTVAAFLHWVARHPVLHFCFQQKCGVTPNVQVFCEWLVRPGRNCGPAVNRQPGFRWEDS